MKAKIYSDRGLLLPKTPLPSMLFLEFVRDYNSVNKVPISLTIKEFDVCEDFSEFLLISINGTRDTRKLYSIAMEYINANC